MQGIMFPNLQVTSCLHIFGGKHTVGSGHPFRLVAQNRRMLLSSSFFFFLVARRKGKPPHYRPSLCLTQEPLSRYGGAGREEKSCDTEYRGRKHPFQRVFGPMTTAEGVGWVKDDTSRCALMFYFNTSEHLHFCCLQGAHGLRPRCAVIHSIVQANFVAPDKIELAGLKEKWECRLMHVSTKKGKYRIR
jgi:hypothetical protein